MSTSALLTMGDRGRVVIPQAVREDQGLQPGDRLIAFADEQGIRLMTREQLEAEVWANYREVPYSLADQLIAERHAEAQRDLEAL